MGIVDNTALEGGPRIGAARSVALDAARGVAVVAMVVFHTAWDLSSLQLIETDVVASPGWSWFARSIAASFLALAGIGLVLAHGDGIRLRAFGRRLAMLVAAALAITAVTRVVFPDSYIFFGILHGMAVSSVLALPFARAPAWAAALMAGFVWAAPLVLTGPAFDAPLLAFLGLGTVVPDTNDYVPVFPWTGFVFAGMAAARLVRARRIAVAAGAGRGWHLLAALGRRSLLVYLLHQPLIFGALAGVQALTGPNPRAEAAPFMAQCERGCVGSGQGAEFCRRSCDCTVEALKREGLWQVFIKGRPTPEQSTRATALAQACVGPLQ